MDGEKTTTNNFDDDYDDDEKDAQSSSSSPIWMEELKLNAILLGSWIALIRASTYVFGAFQKMSSSSSSSSTR